MRNVLTFLFVWSLGFSLSAQMPSQKHFSDIAESEMKANAWKFKPVPMNSILDYDITYHRCSWKVDPSVLYIRGNIVTYFKPLVAAFDSIRFDLSDSLTVDSVKYHNVALTFNHISNVITAAFPSVIAANTLDSVTVFYQGNPGNTGFGSFDTSLHNGTPVMWTLSEPYGSSDWWPCKNSLTDKVDSIDILVTTPVGNKVASNGLLVSVTPSGPNKIFHWKHRHPIATYLICFSTTNYAEYSHNVPFGATNTLVQNFVFPEDSAAAAPQTLGIIPVMQVYDTLFGVYPFTDEKYGHAQFGWGGGMEHTTITFVGGFWHELIAHELGHHWFGDQVTCGSWRDIWLNEGFATYLSGLTYEHMFNGYYWPYFKSSRIDNVTSQPDGSVWCSDTTSVNRIFDSRLTYDKGAMILHQLRWVIGDSAFFTAIKNYLADPALSYGFARTSDLKAHFEASSGQNLTWYFNDWFTGEGYPSYQITWNQTGSTVNLTVNETQSHVSVPFFELPIPIQLKNATQDTIFRLNHTSSGQAFSVTIPFAADSLKFDPEFWLITRNNTVSSVPENELARQVQVFPNPAHGKLQVSLGKPFTTLMLELSDVTGKTVKRISADGLKNVSIDVSGMAKGVYSLMLDNGKQRANKKIIIE